MNRVTAVLFASLVLAPGIARSQGMPVGPEFQVNTYTTGVQFIAHVASDADGNFVVVWESDGQDGAGFGIFGQRYASTGEPLGPEFRANAFTQAFQDFPDVASDSSGNFVVVWRSGGQDGSGYGIFGQRYSGSGSPLGSEFRVNSYTTSEQSTPRVASDAAGNFVVVWQSYGQDQSGWGVFGQRYSGTGAPLGSEFRVNTYTTNYQYSPSVASGPGGNFAVVWSSSLQDGSAYGVFGQRFTSAGVPLGTEFRVNAFTTGTQAAASIALDASSNFVVVWSTNAQDGSGYATFGQRFAGSGTPLGSEFRVNTFTTDEQRAAFVASDSSGNFVVAWTSSGQDGSYSGVFAQRFASSGAPAGPEFRVNTFTTNLQIAWPGSVAADSSGNFVVVWSSDAQDGSTHGVFGQRYGEIIPVELTGFAVE